MPSPHGAPGKFEMRNMNRQLSLSPDSAYFIHCLKNIRSFASHVADVDSAMGRDCLRQSNQLIGLSERAWQIN